MIGEVRKSRPTRPHESRPGMANHHFPPGTRHLHQNNAYQFRHRKFVYMRKWYVLPNETEPFKSAYQEEDMYADYDPMVGIKIAAVLGFFLMMMAVHLFLRSRRKKRERKRQRRILLELAQKRELVLNVEEIEKGLPRIEVDVFDATAEWVQSLDTEDEPDIPKQYLDVVFDPSQPRLSPKSSLKKKNGGSSTGTPSRSHSTKSLPEEEKHVTFDLNSAGCGKRWSSFSGMHGKKRHHGRRKSSSMYVRRSRSHYEPLHRTSYNDKRALADKNVYEPMDNSV